MTEQAGHSCLSTLPNPGYGERRLWALGGIGFAAFFMAGDILNGVIASGSLPLPDASAREVVDFFAANTTATLVLGTCQLLSAVALFLFVGHVGSAVRPAPGGSRTGRVISVGGVLAGVFLAVSALLSCTLAVIAGDAEPGVVATVRDLNFLTGGVAHVVSLGVFVGMTCVAAARAHLLPRGIRWLGIVAAIPAVLSVISLVWYPGMVLLPIGRVLSLLWSIVAAVGLLRRSRRELSVTGEEWNA
jgi:hypothetical protein